MCIATVVSLITISPWTVRNLLVMGEPILTTTNGGYNFYIGNGPGATGAYRGIKEVEFSDFSELDWEREGYKLAINHIVSHPVEWLIVLPKKFFHLWASDWAGVAYTTLPRGYPANTVTLPMMIAQVYWTIIAFTAAVAVFTRPLRAYWMKFPANLLWLTPVYWTFFHMMFHGVGRFHMPLIPLIAIIGVHLLTGDRDWKAWLPSLMKWKR